MAEARYETSSIKINSKDYLFTSTNSKLVFEGFMKVYKQEEEKKENDVALDGLSKGDYLTLNQLIEKQHFTQPPANYTEATLVKTLEELGIGRPSTYSPTISTLLSRRYVIKEDRKLYVTELGEAVDGIMVKAFPSIVDVNFTANLESLLDSVEEGKLEWKKIIRNFYPDLDNALNEAYDKLDKIKIADEETEEICEHCGKNMVIKYGPHGKFLACPGFPECRNTKTYLEKIGVECPSCGGDVVILKTKKGRRYFGCSNHPECDFMTWQKPTTQRCEKCGEAMLEKGKKLVCMDEKCGFIIDKPE